MVLPPDRSPTLTPATSSSSTPTPPGSTPPVGKKPSTYSSLRYSPPKRGTYVVNHQVQSKTKILSIRSTTLAPAGGVSPSSASSSPRPIKKNAGANKHLATPENFELQQSSSSSPDSAKSRKENKPPVIIASQPVTQNCIPPPQTNDLRVQDFHEDVSVNTPLLKKDTELVVNCSEDGSVMMPSQGQNNNSVRIVSNSNAGLHDFHYGSGQRGEKRTVENGCCDCLFNCFECLFVIF
ncbi:putative uncharacterized protein DDB_G0290521 [Folsomia candida]|uniref:Uncharacterized protein n=1 Tax=Folsomia candida TaxID=158441 RepID=A0A226DYF0_FOLCA|nr:putative uncharacterized protein DDB_G0290521 [Folsomia candida]OXA50249.1 hypothetical protein Fcan01_15086 [Folsomia candida]